jgi:hypothetical protein
VAHPFSVIEPTSDCARFIYTTKPQLVSAALSQLETASVGLIGRPGLPRGSDVNLIRNVVRGRGVAFLGDLDVPDLLVFAWLRDRLAPITTEYVGLGDAFFEKIIWFPSHELYLPLSPNGLTAREQLYRLFSDVAQTVGQSCANVLASGEKIELEAAFNRDECTEALVAALSLGAAPSDFI